MTRSGKSNEFRLGFLTSIEMADRGLVGGVLVTDHRGKPLEFQCTTPVKANPTQQILYGPTLKTFLLCELVGRTLVEKLSIKPDLVLLDDADALDLRNHVAVPVACVTDPSATPDESATLVRLGRQQLQLADDFASDAEVCRRGSESVPRDADLFEPFQRVHDALRETLGLGAAA